MRCRRNVRIMTSPIGSFCKTRDCPTSETLLSFQNGTAEFPDDITDHLRDCEFCDAEVAFYRLYPPVEETAVIEEMPEALFELAEALLQKKRDLAPLYKLVGAD